MILFPPILTNKSSFLYLQIVGNIWNMQQYYFSISYLNVKIQVKQKSNYYNKFMYLLQRFERSCTHFQADRLFFVNPQKSSLLSMQKQRDEK